MGVDDEDKEQLSGGPLPPEVSAQPVVQTLKREQGTVTAAPQKEDQPKDSP